MRIIPAIDIIDGKCVRLAKGDYSTKKVYNEHPLEVAKQFENHGISFVHLVDLDGAKARKIVNYKVLEEIASKTSLKIDFGGGLQTDEDLKIAFNSGAQQVTGGSVAVRNKELFIQWLNIFGPDKIILGADARDEKVAISGWEEESDRLLVPFIKGYQKKGIQYVICTDISKDGMLQGPSFDLYSKIINETSISKTSVTMSGVQDVKLPGIKLIASGGVSSMDDLPKLQNIGCEGVILGKALYENKIDLRELEDFILLK